MFDIVLTSLFNNGCFGGKFVRGWIINHHNPLMIAMPAQGVAQYVVPESYAAPAAAVNRIFLTDT